MYQIRIKTLICIMLITAFIPQGKIHAQETNNKARSKHLAAYNYIEIVENADSTDAVKRRYKPDKKPIIIGASQGGDLSYVIGDLVWRSDQSFLSTAGYHGQQNNYTPKYIE